MSHKILFDKENHKVELDTFNNNFQTFEKKDNDWIGLKIFEKYDDAEEFVLKRIDKKKKGTFKKKTPLNAIKRKVSYNEDGYEHTKITSIDPTGYGCQCWVSNGKSRSKEGYEYLLKDTENNWSILKKIKELKEEVEKLKEEKEKFEREELEKYFQNEEDDTPKNTEAKK